MADIALSSPLFYLAGKSGVSAVVGYEMYGTRVVRYTMTSPTIGASHVSLNFKGNYEAGNAIPASLRFYIGTSDTSHANAGSSSEYHGTLTMSEPSADEYTYSGEADVILLPNTTYYLWVFPSSTQVAYVYWTTSTKNTICTASGGAMSDLACGNGTLGTAQILTVTRYTDSFTHTISYVCGTASGTIVDKSSNTSITWTPPLSLASQNTTGTVVSVVVTIQTYSGSTAIGDPVATTVTMAIPESIKPSCVLGVSDYMGHLDTYGAYVKGLSRFSISVVPTTAYGAPIVSYKITANGTTYTAAEVVTDAIASTEYTTITATVTDSRNRTSEVAIKTVSILDYSPPAITSMTAVRCNADGTENEDGDNIKVTFSASVTSLNSLNGAEYTINWKVSGAVDYAGGYAADDIYGDVSVTDYVYIIEGASTTSAYDVEVTVIDNHIGKVRTVIVSTSFALMHFRADGSGMAIGKMSEIPDALEVGLPIFDQFGTSIGAGLAAYSGGGDNGIDPDTTLEELCLTSHSNGPKGLGTFFYIHTVFYNTKSATATRAQVAFPYKQNGSAYHRYYASGAWSSWARYMTSDEVWPINSIYISYSNTSPAELFGGTWYRIQSRFLWGTTTDGTIGATAGEQTHTLTASEMPKHKHEGLFYTNASGSTLAVNLNSGSSGYKLTWTANAGKGANELVTAETGGGAAHNNMPPYVNVAIWRRTA